MLNLATSESQQLQRSAVVGANISSPSNWLLGVVVSYLLGLVFVPLEGVVPITFGAFLYWITATFAFWVSIRFSETRNSFVPDENLRIRVKDRIFATQLVVCISIAGMALLVFDRHVVRGAPLSFDFFAVREALENRSVGSLGMISASLSAFAPFAWVSCHLLRATGPTLGRPWFVVSMFAAIAYVVVSLMAGSRTVLIMVLFVQLFAIHYVRVRFLGRAISIGYLLWLGILMVIGTLLLTSIMYLRLEDMGLDPLISIRSSGYSELLQPSPWLLSTLETKSVGTAAMLAALVSILMYIYHGLFEFSLLFESFAGPHTLGGATLWLPIKVVDTVFGVDFTVDIYSLQGVRFGIFTTFLGPVFIDFGLAAYPALAVLGYLFGVPYRQASERRIEWVPLSLVIYPILILFPIHNMIDSAAGAYLLAAALIIVMLHKTRFLR